MIYTAIYVEKGMAFWSTPILFSKAMDADIKSLPATIAVATAQSFIWLTMEIAISWVRIPHFTHHMKYIYIYICIYIYIYILYNYIILLYIYILFYPHYLPTTDI